MEALLSELVSIENQLDSWRTCRGVRWSDGDAQTPSYWGLGDRSVAETTVLSNAGEAGVGTSVGTALDWAFSALGTLFTLQLPVHFWARPGGRAVDSACRTPGHVYDYWDLET